jgi:hypothetical protein
MQANTKRKLSTVEIIFVTALIVWYVVWVILILRRGIYV